MGGTEPWDSIGSNPSPIRSPSRRFNRTTPARTHQSRTALPRLSSSQFNPSMSLNFSPSVSNTTSSLQPHSQAFRSSSTLQPRTSPHAGDQNRRDFIAESPGSKNSSKGFRNTSSRIEALESYVTELQNALEDTTTSLKVYEHGEAGGDRRGKSRLRRTVATLTSELRLLKEKYDEQRLEVVVLREQADRLGAGDSGALELKGQLKTLQREMEQKSFEAQWYKQKQTKMEKLERRNQQLERELATEKREGVRKEQKHRAGVETLQEELEKVNAALDQWATRRSSVCAIL